MANGAFAETMTQPCLQLLLVEDGDSDAFVVSDLLSCANGVEYGIKHVQTRKEAISALGEQQFDICLLDLKLPDSEGFSALNDLQDKAPSMPVIVLTGVNDTDTAKRAVGRGAQDYIYKDSLEKNALMRSIDHAIERKRSEKILFMRANHDPLTGLANRSMFQTRLDLALARAERTKTEVALLFIDLDRFKHINDSFGHDAGDAVLKSVASRIRASLRAYDMAARFGGDEFVVLLEGVSEPRDAATIAQKIIHAIRPPVLFQGREFVVGASVGIAFSATQVLADMLGRSAALLQQADTAMYHAKKEGGMSYRFYASAMQDVTQALLKCEKEMRQAVLAGEFTLLYQPYMMPGGEPIIGIETLLRWNAPERGLQLPRNFLSVAEECGLMPQIGSWTGAQLQKDMTMWGTHMVPPIEIAINLSGTQLDGEELLEWLNPLVQKAALTENRIAVEISETEAAMLTPARVQMLTRICKLGVGLHLDHFAQGSLSLRVLHSLPFSLLKVDVANIRALNNKKTADAIIQSAILLAHHLGIKAGASGIESPRQMQVLALHRCDSVQGYLTAPPMTAHEIMEWFCSKQRLEWR